MPKSDCSDDGLCKLAETRFCEMDKRWAVEHRALVEQIRKSDELNSIKHLELNHYRTQIDKERAAYITRRETILLNLIISLVVAIVTMGVAHVIFGK